MEKNYAMAGPPRIIYAPSKLSLYLATITCNSLESCWTIHNLSDPNDISHQIIAFFAYKIMFLPRWTLTSLITLAASWKK